MAQMAGGRAEGNDALLAELKQVRLDILCSDVRRRVRKQ
jgi:hypothetical protein